MLLNVPDRHATATATATATARGPTRHRHAMRRARLALFAGSLALAGCHRSVGTRPTAEAEGEASAPLRGWDYTVTISDGLSRADVRVCFSGRPPSALITGEGEAVPWIESVRTGAGEKLRRKDDRWPLDALGDDACVAYAVDLERLVAREGGRRARREGKSVLVRTSQWLLRPDRLPRDAEVTARFVLPTGADLSVPWPRARGDDPARYALDETAFRWLGYTAFGNLHTDRFTHAGTELQIARLDAPMQIDEDDLRQWIIDAAESTALLYGGAFPRERVQVVVVPVAGSGGTVYFGMAARGGGSAIYVLMDDQASGDLSGGWTTVHEMLHHGMPFVDDAWMAEGWVSYYTELTRTWMGHRDEAAGWLALRDAFARGRRGGRLLSLAETSERMHDTYAYQRVYWGGAAIAFLIDVAMRTETRGRLDLEHAMRELRACCGDADHRWAADTLLERLDAWYGRPLFSEIAERHLRDDDFPPVDEAFAALGVSFLGDRVVLDDAHPNAAHRRAIMAHRRRP